MWLKSLLCPELAFEYVASEANLYFVQRARKWFWCVSVIPVEKRGQEDFGDPMASHSS